MALGGIYCIYLGCHCTADGDGFPEVLGRFRFARPCGAFGCTPKVKVYGAHESAVAPAGVTHQRGTRTAWVWLAMKLNFHTTYVQNNYGNSRRYVPGTHVTLLLQHCFFCFLCFFCFFLSLVFLTFHLGTDQPWTRVWPLLLPDTCLHLHRA